MDVSVVIPAYRPGSELLRLVLSLRQSPVASIVVVDDGSGPHYDSVFDQIRSLSKVDVLRHAVNMGKGAALKTGINHVLCQLPECVSIVTADADGQHQPADILAVARRCLTDPDCLVLGSRRFEGPVPWRSKVGNRITRIVFRWLVGQRLSDTQTGLRAIPRRLLPKLMSVQSTGYEFELDMLIAAKHDGIRIVEHGIKTVYQPGNPSSHFNPLHDSLKIYFVLLRFTGVSLLTALLDNTVFFLTFYAMGAVLPAQIYSRIAAVCFNYPAARRAVFLSDESHGRLIPRYLLLVFGSATVSYALMQFLYSYAIQSVILAKIVSETLLFLFNFAVQRDFVFSRSRPASKATNWDQYYKRPFWTATLTRRYSASVLVSLLRRFRPANASEPLVIVEMGGANSCFLDTILSQIQPEEYHVVDLNQYGLEMLRARLHGRSNVYLHCQDVQAFTLDLEARVVFSVGLIEHFDQFGTRQAILSHFQTLKAGGYAVLSFPTPTWLYRAARSITELAGLWRFPDERPLSRQEVLNVAAEYGKLVYEKTLWPLVFTQQIMVIQKTDR